MVLRLASIRSHSGELLRLDLLRFIASAGIVWHHSHEFFHPAAERAAITARTQALALFVDLFFIISGFVISYVYAERVGTLANFRKFMQRRIGRLLPLHWLTLLLAWVFWMLVAHFRLGNEHPVDTSVGCLIRTALFTHAVVPCADGGSPNGVSWSISTEMVLYLMFPLLCLVSRRRGLLAIVIAMLLIAGIMLTQHPGGSWDRLYPPLRGLPSFLFGMLLFTCREQLQRLRLGDVPFLIGTIVMIVLMNLGVSQFLVLAAVYIVGALAVSGDMSGPPGRWIALFAPLGQLTYSIYMWHLFFIIVVMNAVGDKLLHLSTARMAALAAICYSAILAVSYLSWTLVETPARKWIDTL